MYLFYPVILQPISSTRRLIFQFLHYTVRHNQTHRHKWRHTIRYTLLDTQIWRHIQTYTPMKERSVHDKNRNLHITQYTQDTQYKYYVILRRVRANIFSKTYVHITYSVYVIIAFLYAEPKNAQLIVNCYAAPHVSTLTCHPQVARSQYLAKLHKHVNIETQLDTHSDKVHTGQHNDSINIETVYTATIQVVI